MKSVLIITSQGSRSVSWLERQGYIEDFCRQTGALLKSSQVFYTTYQEIVCNISDGLTTFTDLKNDKELKKYDFIQFKNWHGNLEFASLIARYCQDNGVMFVNHEVAVELNIGKLSQAYVLNRAGLPVPRTLHIMSETLQEMTDSQIAEYGFTMPFIVKQIDGSKGDNNFLCRSYEELRNILKKDEDQLFTLRPQYVIQEFIPNDGDYRVLYIGTDRSPFVFLRKANNGSHLNNTSKGGQGGLVEIEHIPKEYLYDAVVAARTVKCEIAGVDILVDKTTGQHYVLEVNSTPALATGFMVEEKTRQFSDFIERITKE